MRQIKRHMSLRDASLIVKASQEKALRAEIAELRHEVEDLRERMATLEWTARRDADERGYQEQGSRYPGNHPRTCACDRCLQRQFGRYSS